MESVIVTRHQALVEYIFREKIAPQGTKVIPHATAEEVTGMHVIGVLPLHLAALAAKVTVVEMDIPLSHRGVELSLANMDKMVTGVNTYLVWDVLSCKETVPGAD